jgi:hypothetical protein
VSFGFTTSSAESAPKYGPTATERRRAYEETHRNRYFVVPTRSESKQWECWEECRDADDVLVGKHTGLTQLIAWLEAQDAGRPQALPETGPGTAGTNPPE